MAKKASSEQLAEYRRKRDFSRSPEPAGEHAERSRGERVFVIQKHAARRLHFDLRLEVGGVMKSWAVPKGPSLDPSIKRLAVEVEDHPLEYNDFEGTIPAGEYGGGTVMLWDRGTYEVEGGEPGDAQDQVMQRAHRSGKISLTFFGERLTGGFTLVRTSGARQGSGPQWLLIKQEDSLARHEGDIVAEHTTSIDSGRSMDQIAAGVGRQRVWHSNRAETAGSTPPADPLAGATTAFSPMLCSASRQAPEGPGWTFEPKLDGIRAIALITPAAVSLITRNGNEKSTQFPEVVEGLRALAEAVDRSLVLDGEIVGRDPAGRPLRFESLQPRMHVQDRSAIERHARTAPAAFVAFDVLLHGDEVLLREKWKTRREVLEALLTGRTSETVHLVETSIDADEILGRARERGWEGAVAKRTDSRYQPGKRSRDWVKIKAENQQEFVIGGWTEPRSSRSHLGAILLGYYAPDGALVYVGHTGAGFSQRSLEEVHARLKRLERKTSPFHEVPRTNETPHWTTPKLVAEVRFNQWTKDGKLRQPTFLGIREDKDPKEVVREPGPAPGTEPDAAAAAAPERGKKSRARPTIPPRIDPITERIREIEKKGGSGRLVIDADQSVDLTNLRKIYFPGDGITKGDLLAYYAGMAEHILPWMADRPLVLKRFPNGIESEAFYQQTAPDSVPRGVGVENLQEDPDSAPERRLIGGSLATLLYTVQLGAISYDPWHSRVGRMAAADYSIIDLDPGPGADFQQVVQVARWVKEDLDDLGLHGALKTSGSRGLHVYLPLPPDTPLDASTLIAQIVATRVARKHPRETTIERMTRNRPSETIYLDYLQNILGKTIAGVYAVRAKPGATVSTPLEWDELTDELDLRDFTMRTVPDRVARSGDLWAPAMAIPNSLEKLSRSRGT